MSLPNLCPACGKFPQNCTCNPESATLLRELLEHEQQTHEQLGAILGTDDSLPRCAQRLKDKYDDLREFVRLITLQLQEHAYKTPDQWSELFQFAYRTYVKHDVENQSKP